MITIFDSINMSFYRQLIFTELPTTLESFMSDKFQAWHFLESSVNSEMAVPSKTRIAPTIWCSNYNYPLVI